jgi:autotransporter-associated beta strand protein
VGTRQPDPHRTNDYTGGTTVSGGTLIGTTSSLQGSIVNNAAVVFDQGFDGTYVGSMSGSGGLTTLGIGAVTLGGVNTYTGATTISGGTLALSGSGSIATSSGVALATTVRHLRHLGQQRRPDDPGPERCGRHVRSCWAATRLTVGYGKLDELQWQYLRGSGGLDQAGQWDADP